MEHHSLSKLLRPYLINQEETGEAQILHLSVRCREFTRAAAAKLDVCRVSESQSEAFRGEFFF